MTPACDCFLTKRVFVGNVSALRLGGDGTHNPIVAGGQLYFLAPDPTQSGQRYVMHCVD